METSTKEICRYDPSNTDDKGMDLRDYFAARAMQSLINDEVVMEQAEAHESDFPKLVASMAYDMADEMIKARQE